MPETRPRVDNPPSASGSGGLRAFPAIATQGLVSDIHDPPR